MNKPARVPRLLSIHELAELFSVSSRTIHRWIAAGELPTHKLGRQIRITEDDARRFLATRAR
jgi:putative molybdopterin biosynthesis protein